MTQNPDHSRRRRFGGLAIVAAIAIVIPAGSALAFFGTILDPTNLVENAAQLEAIVDTLNLAKMQIRLQCRLLAHLPVSIAEPLNEASVALQEQLGAGGLGTVGESAGHLASLYPTHPDGRYPGRLDNARPVWDRIERDSLIHARQLSAHLSETMTAGSLPLDVLIESSNGVGCSDAQRPGVVAVTQAQHELLALLSAETNKLTAARSLRAQRRLQRIARQQAELAYHRARRDALMRDWGTSPRDDAPAIPMPFVSTSRRSQ